jgi:hypothetical protein
LPRSKIAIWKRKKFAKFSCFLVQVYSIFLERPFFYGVIIMRVTCLRRRLLSAAALLMLFILADPTDVSAVMYDEDTTTVYRQGRQYPSLQNMQTARPRSAKHHARRHRHRRHKGGDRGGDNIGIDDNAVPVPDGGSTLAMTGGAVLLLLGYRRFSSKAAVA